MSDDLVKQGRAVERDLNNGFPMTCEKSVIIQQMADRIEELEAKLAKATKRLIQATEESLWSAYHSGHCDEAGAWTHMFMSDGEWLMREIGMDPKIGGYDAEEIRGAIPATARKIVMAELKGQDE